jgi:hypothetical protein
LLAVFLLPLPLSAALVGPALFAQAAGKASTSSDVYRFESVEFCVRPEAIS